MKSLSVADAARFNHDNPDAKGVYYQSWAGVSTATGGVPKGMEDDLKATTPEFDGKRGDFLHPMMYPTALALSQLAPGKANDGTVTVDSAQWGNFRGVVPADHWDIGGVGGGKSSENRTGFDPAEFYRQMARDLAKRGY